jgi:hypothetical protein
MYAVVNRMKFKGSFTEAANEAEAELMAILYRSPGFLWRYNVDAGDGVGVGITIFESAEHWAAAVPVITDWVVKNIYPLFETEPMMTAGEVILSAGVKLPALLQTTPVGGEELSRQGGSA